MGLFGAHEGESRANFSSAPAIFQTIGMFSMIDLNAIRFHLALFDVRRSLVAQGKAMFLKERNATPMHGTRSDRTHVHNRGMKKNRSPIFYRSNKTERPPLAKPLRVLRISARRSVDASKLSNAAVRYKPRAAQWTSPECAAITWSDCNMKTIVINALFLLSG